MHSLEIYTTIVNNRTWVWSFSGMTQRKTLLRQNTVPVALCPPQIPCRRHGIEPWPLKILPLLGQQQANYCAQSTRWSPLVMGVFETLWAGGGGGCRVGGELQDWYQWERRTILLQNWKHQAFRAARREEVNSANAFRMGSDNQSWVVHLCACAPIALLDHLLVGGLYNGVTWLLTKIHAGQSINNHI